MDEDTRKLEGNATSSYEQLMAQVQDGELLYVLVEFADHGKSMRTIRDKIGFDNLRLSDLNPDVVVSFYAAEVLSSL